VAAAEVPATRARVWLERALLAAVIGGPLLFQAEMVKRLGVNMLIGDEFYYTPFVHLVRTGGDWSGWILMQHNEHRMVPMKFVLAAVAAWTPWNVVTEMYLSVVVVGLTLWGLWGIHRAATGRGPLAFLPVGLLLCSPAQHFNMLTGMQVAFYFTALGMVWSSNLLRKNSFGGTLQAAGWACFATFSTATGFGTWPVGLIQLIVMRAGRARILGWCAAAAACGLLYFRGYESPPLQAPLGFVGVPSFVRFFLAVLGGPLGCADVARTMWVGAIVAVAVVGWIVFDFYRDALSRPDRAAVHALILMGVASAALVTIGRANFGIEFARESRYVTFTQLALVGLYLLAVGSPVPKAVAAAHCALLAAGLFAVFPYGIDQGRLWRWLEHKRKACLLTYETQPPTALRDVYTPWRLVHYARYLKHEKLGPFADENTPIVKH
jgi:hypothetical protein